MRSRPGPRPPPRGRRHALLLLMPAGTAAPSRNAAARPLAAAKPRGCLTRRSQSAAAGYRELRDVRMVSKQNRVRGRPLSEPHRGRRATGMRAGLEKLRAAAQAIRRGSKRPLLAPLHMHLYDAEIHDCASIAGAHRQTSSISGASSHTRIRRRASSATPSLRI